MPRGLSTTLFEYQATRPLSPEAARQAWNQDFFAWLGSNRFRLTEQVDGQVTYTRARGALLWPLWSLAAKREFRLIVRFAPHGTGTRIMVSGQLPTRLYEQLEAALPPDPPPPAGAGGQV